MAQTEKLFRCTFEWDKEVGKDERNDAVLKRHICKMPMHHSGDHVSLTKDDVTQALVSSKFKQV